MIWIPKTAHTLLPHKSLSYRQLKNIHHMLSTLNYSCFKLIHSIQLWKWSKTCIRHIMGMRWPRKVSRWIILWGQLLSILYPFSVIPMSMMCMRLISNSHAPFRLVTWFDYSRLQYKVEMKTQTTNPTAEKVNFPCHPKYWLGIDFHLIIVWPLGNKKHRNTNLG